MPGVPSYRGRGQGWGKGCGRVMFRVRARGRARVMAYLARRDAVHLQARKLALQLAQRVKGPRNRSHPLQEGWRTGRRSPSVRGSDGVGVGDRVRVMVRVGARGTSRKG